MLPKIVFAETITVFSLCQYDFLAKDYIIIELKLGVTNSLHHPF